MSKISNISIASTLSHFKNPSAVLPVLLVEVGASLGRIRQAHRRGGPVEAKESALEETSSAGFWLFGAKAFNKIGDFIGKKVFGLEHLDVDVGKDALRQPFDNIVKDKKTATAVFKFSKIFASVTLATYILGFVIPKVKQNMTKKDMLKNKKPLPNPIFNMNGYISHSKHLSKTSPQPSFKGIVDKLLVASHKIENDTKWRLIFTDSGMVVGRTTSARNPAESREFFVRDVLSTYGYMFAAQHTIDALNKASSNVDIHPAALVDTAEYLSSKLQDKPLTTNEFRKYAYGTGILGNAPFDKDGVITLDEFNKYTNNAYKDKARLMSELQPKRLDVSMLSKKQVQDIVSDKWTTDPVFLKKAISKGTFGASDNPKRFVSRAKTQGVRDSIDEFAKYVADYADIHGIEKIDAKLVKKLASENIKKAALFQATGLCAAIFFLAVVVPKLKDYMTKITTGQDYSPGVMSLEG